jgi:hypothetical protein
MAAMAVFPAGPVRLSRRSFLAVSATGMALVATGCTSGGSDEGEPVTAAQVDSLADQVAAQELLVAAYAAATAADAGLGQQVAPLGEQAGRQLERLRAASPGTAADPSSPAPSSAAPPSVGPDVRGWLRGQVTATADSHAAACLQQTGARAALLGSVAAGLRGHAARLA